jgi:lipoprotein signal peptidase
MLMHKIDATSYMSIYKIGWLGSGAHGNKDDRRIETKVADVVDDAEVVASPPS